MRDNKHGLQEERFRLAVRMMFSHGDSHQLEEGPRQVVRFPALGVFNTQMGKWNWSVLSIHPPWGPQMDQTTKVTSHLDRCISMSLLGKIKYKKVPHKFWEGDSSAQSSFQTLLKAKSV